MNFDGSCW